ncbi:hypothetical protein BGZ73_003375 [Actinomortierella ambigua]|nr:hypothetical protein BGZ73_003375 [Actinomortierella ambigua]
MTTSDSNSFLYTPPPPPSPRPKVALLSSADQQHETQYGSRTSKEIESDRLSQTRLAPPTATGQQVRYCYFVSAASASTSRSRNPSLSRHTVYLTPHVQDDFAPNGPQPRSGRRSTGDTPRSKDKPFVLGAQPPQIQLQFLQGEPLPPPQTSQSPDELLNTIVTDISSHQQDEEGIVKSASGVQVARKDSGYSSSLSRQSSIMALGRGIRKVFWRTSSTSSKRSFDALPSSQTHSLEYKIPQDMIDQDEWADDLAQRLSEASSSHNLPVEWSVETIGPTKADTLEHTSTVASATEGLTMDEAETPVQDEINVYQVTIHASPLVVTEVPHAPTILTETTIISDDTPDSPPALKPVVSYPAPPKVLAATPARTTLLLRSPPSLDCLNKPQPAVPAPQPPSPSTKPSFGLAVPSQHRQIRSSSVNSLSGLVRRLTTVEFAWKKGKSKTAPVRPSVQRLFQVSTSEVQLNNAGSTGSSNGAIYRRRPSSNLGILIQHGIRSVENLQDIQGTFVQSPEEMSADSYTFVKLGKQPKRSLLPWNWVGPKSDKLEDTIEQTQDSLTPSSENIMSEERLLAAQHAAVGGLRRSGTRRATISELEAQAFKQASMLSCDRGEWILAPPEPLFMAHGPHASSTSTLGDHSSCTSVDNSTMDSADEWDLPGGLRGSPASYGFSRPRPDSSRYSTDLKTLRNMLLQDSSQAGPDLSVNKPLPPPSPSFAQNRNNDSDMSTNSSLVSLTSNVARSPSPSPSPSPAFLAKNGVVLASSVASKKDKYAGHLRPMSAPLFKGQNDKGKKHRNKKVVRSSYGGGEVEIVKQAKFDTPEAIAKNLEIRRFIAKEIYTTEVNYLQYLQTVNEVFVKPLWNSFETSKPILPASNGLCQLLAHIPTLMAVSSRITQLLADRVDDENWSDTESLIGTAFLEVKEPLSVFLKYGQSYGKGMRALRSLLKTYNKRLASSSSSAAANTAMTATTVPTASSSTMKAARRSLPPSPLAAGEWTEKRLSLPPMLQLTLVMTEDDAMEAAFQDPETVIPKSSPGKPRSIHGVLDSYPSDEVKPQEYQSPKERRVGSTHSNVSHCSSRSSRSRTPSITQQIVSKFSGEKQVAFSETTETILTDWEQYARHCAGVKEVTGRFSLADLLILPIQRVTRYCLLLKDLKKHTDTDHQDFICLVHALEQVHALAMATNNVQQVSSLRVK